MASIPAESKRGFWLVAGALAALYIGGKLFGKLP